LLHHCKKFFLPNSKIFTSIRTLLAFLDVNFVAGFRRLPRRFHFLGGRARRIIEIIRVKRDDVRTRTETSKEASPHFATSHGANGTQRSHLTQRSFLTLGRVHTIAAFTAGRTHLSSFFSSSTGLLMKKNAQKNLNFFHFQLDLRKK
jgi:hypothetical protein